MAKIDNNNETYEMLMGFLRLLVANYVCKYNYDNDGNEYRYLSDSKFLMKFDGRLRYVDEVVYSKTSGLSLVCKEVNGSDDDVVLLEPTLEFLQYFTYGNGITSDDYNNFINSITE